MKLKNLLKKTISTLLCVSTLSFSVGMLSTHSLSAVCNLNLIDNVLSLTNCTTWSPTALEYYQSIPHAVCADNGLCNHFNSTNQLIGSNSPTQQASSPKQGFFSSAMSNPYLVQQIFLTFLAPLAFKLGEYLFTQASNKLAQLKNEEKLKKEGSIEPIETVGKFNYYSKDIKGQEKALNEIEKFIINFADERKQVMEGIKKDSINNNILYCWGNPGIGKSITAECIAKTLNGPNAEPSILEPSQIDSDKIFGVIARKTQSGEVNQFTPVVKQLIQNPYTVFIFNEVDKYDKKGEKKYLKELEEVLRTIHDHGYIYINGIKIDCSKAVFILTSNADLRYTREDQAAKDPARALTQVEHDTSFLDRIKVVEFKDLDAKAYKEIAKPKLEALQMRYLNEYNVYITFNDNILDEISKLVERKNQGARPIQEFINAINSKLLNEVILQGAKDKSYRGKAIEISLENKDNNPEFKLNDSDNYKKTLSLAFNNLKHHYLTQHNIKLNINVSDKVLDELATYLKDKNLPTTSILSLHQTLDKKINEEIILKENSKKSLWQKFSEKVWSSKTPSYSGKTYNVQLRNYQWEISEYNPSQENTSVESNFEQDSEVKETTSTSTESEIEKQKAESKTLEGSSPSISIEKNAIETPVSVPAAAA